LTDGQQSNKKKSERKNNRHSLSIYWLNKLNRRRKIIFVLLLLMSTEHCLLIRKKKNTFACHSRQRLWINFYSYIIHLTSNDKEESSRYKVIFRQIEKGYFWSFYNSYKMMIMISIFIIEILSHIIECICYMYYI
jgi:hypothetical protein